MIIDFCWWQYLTEGWLFIYTKWKYWYYLIQYHLSLKNNPSNQPYSIPNLKAVTFKLPCRFIGYNHGFISLITFRMLFLNVNISISFHFKWEIQCSKDILNLSGYNSGNSHFCKTFLTLFRIAKSTCAKIQCIFVHNSS